MIFDLSKGNEPGIENILKTCSTERKELKEESSQPESFSLKIGFFFFLFGRKTGSINPILKNQKILKTWEFSVEIFLKQFLLYEMHVNDSKCFQKLFPFNQIKKIYQASKIFLIQFLIQNPKKY